MSLHFPVLPMKATMAVLPDGDDWAYEIKWDGYRTIAHIDDGRVRLQSTAGHDVSQRWTELAGLAGAVNAPSAILDGELVVLDDHGKPSFELVQGSGVGAVSRPADTAAAPRREAALYLFDVLAVDGTDTIDLPYEDRRRLLEQLVEAGSNWLVPSHRVGDGADLLAVTHAEGLEGVVAKRLGSPYRPGIRSKDWRKIKNRRRIEVSIGGYTAGTGNRASTFGALLVGVPVHERPANERDETARDRSGAGAHENPATMRFAGGVGTGFDRSTLERLTALLHDRRTDVCPFDPPPPASYRRGATWVEPSLRATVEIAEFTNDGMVRHASFVALAD